MSLARFLLRMMMVSPSCDRGKPGGAKQSPKSSSLHRPHRRSHRVDVLEVFGDGEVRLGRR